MFQEKFVSWKGLNDRISVENCHITTGGNDIVVNSNVTGIDEKLAFHCSYNFLIEKNWHIKQFEVNLLLKGEHSIWKMHKNAAGTWLRDGNELKEFAGCIDIDLTVTPFTNTLPVNRLSIAVGDRKEISVVYIDILEQKIYKADQVYTRLSKGVYLFEMASVDFRAEILIDESSGLVVDYPPLFTSLKIDQ